MQDIQLSSNFIQLFLEVLQNMPQEFLNCPSCSAAPALPWDPLLMSHPLNVLRASHTPTARIVHQNWATSALSVLPPKIINPKTF